jgi:hypothetical protein
LDYFAVNNLWQVFPCSSHFDHTFAPISAQDLAAEVAVPLRRTHGRVFKVQWLVAPVVAAPKQCNH